MKVGEDFAFKRKFWVKDLLKADSIIANSAVLRFDSFNSFVKHVLVNKDIILTCDKFIVPVEKAEEVRVLLAIDDAVRPLLVMNIDNYNEEILEAFNPERIAKIGNTAVEMDSKNIAAFSEFIRKNELPNFKKFMTKSYGYFYDYVSSNNIHNLIDIYSKPFFELPYFCIADITYDWFNICKNFKISEIDNFKYICTFIATNIKNTKKTLFLNDGEFETTYEFFYEMTKNSKKIFINEDHGYYCDFPEYGDAQIQKFNFKSVNANTVEQEEISKIRAPYDCVVDTSVIPMPSIDNMAQNFLCTGSHVIPPTLCKLIGEWLLGDKR